MGASGDGGRYHAVDHVKAFAIVAVVFTHAGRVTLANPGTTADFLLTSLWTRFHVPSFLFVSGFLYASRSPVHLTVLGRRWARVLLPYLVASLLVMAIGLIVYSQSPPPLRWPALVRGPGDVTRYLLTASALGIYYYVFLIWWCILLVWPLSRTGSAGAWVVCLGSAALVLAIDLGLVGRPAAQMAQRFGGNLVFWVMRSPVEEFHVGYFATGWLAALYLPRLARFRAERPALALCLCLAGVALGWASFAQLLDPPGGFGREVYSLAVVGLVAIATRAREAGPVVRFLGDASLGIYLFHRIFQLLAEPFTSQWPALLRIGAQVAVGLAGGCLLLLAGRRLLGVARARRWLGA